MTGLTCNELTRLSTAMSYYFDQLDALGGVLPDALKWPEPIEFTRDPETGIVSAKSTSSSAHAAFLWHNGGWTVQTNDAFEWLLGALRETAFGFLLRVLEHRVEMLKSFTTPVVSTTDCRSEDGITMGLVDAVISMCRVIRHRDLNCTVVQEALKDLGHDEDFLFLIKETKKAR